MSIGSVLVLVLLVPILALIGAILVVPGFMFLDGLMPYLLLVIISLVTGWLVRLILHNTKVSASTGVITGMLAPIPAIAFITAAFKVLSALTAQIEPLGGASARAGSAAYLFAEPPSFIIVSLIFYVLFNAFILLAFIKHKDRSMLLYLLAPIALLIAYGLGILISNNLISIPL